MDCPHCLGATLLFKFETNTFSCLKCHFFKKNIDLQLATAFSDKKLRWNVRFAENELHQKIFILQRNGAFFGTLSEYLGGVMYLKDFKGDEEGLMELSEALYRAFGIYALHDGREVRTLVEA